MQTRQPRLLAALASATALAILPVAGAPAATAAGTTQVQRDLSGLGYLTGTGSTATTAAVKAFQAGQCLPVDGVVSAPTRRALEDTVEAVQAVAGTGVDGDYGRRTRAAVSAWQARNGLPTTGVADARTMAQMTVQRTRVCGTPRGVVDAGATPTAILEWNLVGLGYLTWADVDGVVSARTTAAIEAAQADRCVDVDGTPGTRTHTALREIVREAQGKVGITSRGGAYGPRTKAAVAAWQRAHDLPADGILDAPTMKGLGIARVVTPCKTPAPDPTPGPVPAPTPPPAPAPGDLGQQIADIAARQLADEATNREMGGYNCNWYTTQWGRGGGAGCTHAGWRTEQWCADFAGWVWKQAGAQVGGVTAAAGSFGTYGERHGTLTRDKPEVGDAIVLNRSAASAHHVALVIAVNGSTVTTIGGNSGSPADRVAKVDYTFPRSNIEFVSPVPMG